MFALDDKSKHGFTPVIQIIIDDKEVAGLFYSRLIKASIRDEPGQSSDMATIELDDSNNDLDAPREKAKIEINLGFLETGLRPRGVYELQNIQFSGDSGGEKMILQAKAADLRRALKGSNRKYHEDTTYGEIVRELAKRAKLEAVIDPTLDKIPISEFQDQSDIDFLTRLSDEHDAVIKPAGGKLVAIKRGSGKSASGRTLPPLIVRKSDCDGWSIEPDGRVEFGTVKTGYIDQKTGKRIEEHYDTGLSGPVFVLPDIAANKEKARSTAEAEARRLNRNTGDGYFRLYGRPEAMAEQPLVAEGFRAEINGEWRAESVEEEFGDNGYLTTITIKANEKGRKSKGKKESDDE